MSIRSKFLVPALLVMVLSVIALGVANYYSSEDIIYSQLYIEANSELDTMISLIEENNLDIQKNIDKFKVGASGYAYIVNDEGIVIAHPNEKDIGLSLNEFDWGRYILKEQQGDKIYSYGGFEKFTVFKKMGNDIAVIAVPYNEFMDPLDSLKDTIVLVLVSSIILLSVIFYILIKKIIINPINVLMDKMKEAENGVLTASIPITSKDEFGILSKSYNGMLNNIKQLVHNAGKIAESSEITVDSITSAVEEVSLSSEDISNSVQEIAMGANNQAEESSGTLEESNMLGEAIDNVTEKIKETEKEAEKMKEKNESGMSSVMKLEEKFNDYLNVSNKLSTSIFELSSKSKSIESIVSAIDAISEQTNLLALNAAIEAARAGEHGKGFSVVAEEIRKLAEQSRNSTKEVQNIIEQITMGIDDTNEMTENSKSLVDEVDSSIEDVRDVFDNIKVSIDRVVGVVVELKDDIIQIDNSKETVLKAMENISAISQQSAAATQEISAASQQQTASMEEVASSMQELNTMIGELAKAIETFKVE